MSQRWKTTAQDRAPVPEPIVTHEEALDRDSSRDNYSRGGKTCICLVCLTAVVPCLPEQISHLSGGAAGRLRRGQKRLHGNQMYVTAAAGRCGPSGDT